MWGAAICDYPDRSGGVFRRATCSVAAEAPAVPPREKAAGAADVVAVSDRPADAPDRPADAPDRPATGAAPCLTDDEALRLLVARNSGVRPLDGGLGYRLVKRAFDVCASGAAIAVLAIPSAILCAVICAKSHGASPIYSQWRIGRVDKDGGFRAFRMLKFRSMVPQADEMLPALQDRNEASFPLFKIREDPRVIPGVGPFIRKHSIDELPQLLNVFVGDMSLIGPRPGLPREVANYDGRAMGRLRVRPGCGGLWQCQGRSDVGFEDMVDMDLEYISDRSLGQDLRLIFATLGAMLSGEGAA